MRVIRITCASLLLLAGACMPRRSESDLRVVEPRAKKSYNVITQEELQDPQITSRDAYTAIRHLRPHFFTYHGPASFMTTAGETQISYDYGPLRPVSELASTNTFSIVEVRYLNAEAAQGRFGLNANSGPVIVLLSNKDAR